MRATLFTSNFNKIFKIGFFILIFIILFHQLGLSIYERSSMSNKWKAVYEAKDKLDVVFVGNSHVYCTFNTDLLTKSGINSCIVGTGSETFGMTYYNIKEILRVKPPKILVIEIYSLFRDDEDIDIRDRKIYSMHSMKFSRNLIDYITETLEYNDYLNALFPQIYFHDKWKNISQFKDNYNRNTSISTYLYGFKRIESVISEEDYNNRQKKTVLQKTISEKNFNRLKEVIELCDKVGTEVLFVKAPVLENGQAFNYGIEKIESTFNREVINYNNKLDELDLLRHDFFDIEHVNQYGANKVTLDFADNVLCNNFGFEYDLKNSRAVLEIEDLNLDQYENEYKFTVETYSENLVYAFYLYKNNEKHLTQKYSKKNYFNFSIQEKGKYKIQYFIADKYEDYTNPKNIPSDRKRAAYFEEIIIQ